MFSFVGQCSKVIVAQQTGWCDCLKRIPTYVWNELICYQINLEIYTNLYYEWLIKYDAYIWYMMCIRRVWYSNGISVKQHQASRPTICTNTISYFIYTYLHHIISLWIHYKYPPPPPPTHTHTHKHTHVDSLHFIKSLYKASHKLKHFWSQIVPDHEL